MTTEDQIAKALQLVPIILQESSEAHRDVRTRVAARKHRVIAGSALVTLGAVAGGLAIYDHTGTSASRPAVAQPCEVQPPSPLPATGARASDKHPNLADQATTQRLLDSLPGGGAVIFGGGPNALIYAGVQGDTCGVLDKLRSLVEEPDGIRVFRMPRSEKYLEALSVAGSNNRKLAEAGVVVCQTQIDPVNGTVTFDLSTPRPDALAVLRSNLAPQDPDAVREGSLCMAPA